MIQFLSRSAANAWRTENKELAREVVAKAQRQQPFSATFLSHSSKDADLLPVVVRILENHGAKVYVDKKDPTLPPYTDRETAAILRRRIKDAKKFILLASENSKDSRWVPWELGLADGYRRPDNVALFPSSEDGKPATWAKAEYLGIYDRVVYGDLNGYSDRVWMVWNEQENTATELGRWLRN